MRNIIKTVFAAVAVMGTLCACDKDNDEVLTQNTSQQITVTSAAGIKAFGVQTTGKWSASIDEASQRWCKFEGPSDGDGVGAFTLNYTENGIDGVRRGIRREAVITVITGDKFTSKTIYLRQCGLTPTLGFTTTEASADADAESTLLAVNTNLSIYEATEVQLSVSGNWAADARVAANGAAVTVLHGQNATGEDRKATLRLTYTDAWGEQFSTECTLTQLKAEEQPAPTVLNF